MNQTAIAFVKARETCVLTAYKPTPNDKWTIGWGHTGSDVYEGLVWTQDQADAALVKDMQGSEDTVNRTITVALSERQQAALISLEFNAGGLPGSHIVALTNARDWLGAAHEFPRWDHQGATELKGLLIRRFYEAAMFLEGTPATPAPLIA